MYWVSRAAIVFFVLTGISGIAWYVLGSWSYFFKSNRAAVIKRLPLLRYAPLSFLYSFCTLSILAFIFACLFLYQNK